jgi:RimJ/RimL family protein N-acetyltransferase
LLALAENEEAFERSFGVPAADGLRQFIVSDDVSEIFIRWLKESTSADVWRHGFAVVDRQTNQVVGSAGYKGPPDDNGMVEIAYGIVPAFEGRGYATEAAAELVRFAFADSRVCRIWAHTLPESNASTRVLTKNGFDLRGDQDDPEDGTVWRWELERSG